MGLGPLRHISLAEAREKADAARRLKRDGIDPLDAKHDKQLGIKKTAKRMSFKQCADAYFAAHAAGWSKDHTRQWPKSLEVHAHPVIGDLPVAAIDLGLVLQVLEPMWNTKTETASRVRSRIEAVLDWAKARGYRTGENPACWKGHLDTLLGDPTKLKEVAREKNGKGENHAALPYGEIGDFMAKLRQQDHVAARALEFAILTAARTDEVREAPWSEFEHARTQRMWVIPGSRMKNRKEHRVPLSDAALAILDRMAAIRVSDFVFNGRDAGKPIGAVAMYNVLKGLAPDVTVHGFRSSFRDWCTDKTDVPSEMAEFALAHKVGDKTRQAYARSDMVDKRRALMADWAGYCGQLPEEHGTVVPFAR